MKNPRQFMTERQLAAWPEVQEELELHGVEAGDLWTHGWTVSFREESRPGRGQHMDAIYCDGEHLAHVSMDVYGYPTVAIAELDWIHNNSDEECECEHCKKERMEEGYDS